MLDNIFFKPSKCSNMGFPSGSDSKESACKAGDPDSVPGLGRSPGKGNGYPVFFFFKSQFNLVTIGVHACMHVCVQSHFSHVRLFAAPWTVACLAPPSMGFSRQEYWSGVTCPSPGDLPNPGIKPRSPALAGKFFTTSATWEAPTPVFSQSMGSQRVRHG